MLISTCVAECGIVFSFGRILVEIFGIDGDGGFVVVEKIIAK